MRRDTAALANRTPGANEERRPFVRNRSDRIVAGVAAGLGDLLGVERVLIRLAFVVLSFAGGVGVVAYLLLWVLSSEKDGPGVEEARVPPAVSVEKTIAVGLVVGGILLLLRASGVWFGDAIVWPVALGAFGSAVIWVRAGDDRRDRWSRAASRHPVESVLTGPMSRGRIALGAFLVAGGMAVFLATHSGFGTLGGIAAATAVTAAGLALVLGPWILRLTRQAHEERRERIRSEERAELAAHLHDSVLQSLALIQRSSSPEQMVGLARAQERELRAWLYGHAGRVASDSLAAAFEETAARVERSHNVRIEVVTVGDTKLDERLGPLLLAAAEAMANAAGHSGVAEIDAYLEVEPDAVVAFVRDQGKGFDVDAVPSDRMGVTDSIRGRMDRAGGTAAVRSVPGRGTEVELRAPLEPR